MIESIESTSYYISSPEIALYSRKHKKILSIEEEKTIIMIFFVNGLMVKDWKFLPSLSEVLMHCELFPNKVFNYRFRFNQFYTRARWSNFIFQTNFGFGFFADTLLKLRELNSFCSFSMSFRSPTNPPCEVTPKNTKDFQNL